MSYWEPNQDPSRPNNLVYGFSGTYERLPFQAWDFNDYGDFVGDLENDAVIWRDRKAQVLTSSLDPAWRYHGHRLTNSGLALIRGTLSIEGAPWTVKTYLWRGDEPEPVADLMPVDLNERGDILMIDGTEFAARSYLWSEGKLTPIGPKGFHAGFLDKSGRVGGDLFESEDVCRPARWENGQFSLFPIPPGHQGHCEAMGYGDTAVVSIRPEDRNPHDVEDTTIVLFERDNFTGLVEDALWCSDAYINDHGNIALGYALARGIPCVYEETSELLTKSGARYPISSASGEFRSMVALNNKNEILLMDDMVIWLVKPDL